MEFYRRAARPPRRLGILPGTFNPVTMAHLALARAALAHVDEVVFVLPRVFPHKDYAGASFEERVAMLEDATAGEQAFSIAAASGGLFVEIARECRQAYGDEIQLTFLCGRDAAERIAGWDYGRAGAFSEMLREFDLLVAARDGAYEAPSEYAHAVRCIDLGGLDAISATEVRERIRRGAAWEHLAPPAIRDRAREIYSKADGGGRSTSSRPR
jgi:nicotinate (nicotinamide) nucleotide adenylyltransferase